MSKKRFDQPGLIQVAFTPPGSKYAAVIAGYNFMKSPLPYWDPGSQSLVRIHERRSGKLLAAFAAPTCWADVPASAPMANSWS